MTLHKTSKKTKTASSSTPTSVGSVGLCGLEIKRVSGNSSSPLAGTEFLASPDLCDEPPEPMVMTRLSSSKNQTDITISCSTPRTGRHQMFKNAFTQMLPGALEQHAWYLQTELTKQVSENSFLPDYNGNYGIRTGHLLCSLQEDECDKESCA